MTTRTIAQTDARASHGLIGIARRIGAAFAGFGRFIANNSEGMRCAREAERLFRLSDDELARRGLTRDRVVHHAFRRYLNG